LGVAWGLLGALLLWTAPTWSYGQPVAPSQEEREALKGLKGQLAGEIVFSSRRDGKWRLFRILPDDTELARLSTGSANHNPALLRSGRDQTDLSQRPGWPQPDMASRPRLR